MTRPAREVWSTRRLLAWMSERFTKAGIDQPRLSAEMLLAHVLRCPRLRLYMEADRPASELERAALRSLVERALAHEPVDYLVGETTFFGLAFKVDPRVLIPRPSTETLVDHVIQHARHSAGFRSATLADVGTGSGAIAVALAKHLPSVALFATDTHQDALDLARENALAHRVDDRITFRRGDLLEPLRGLKLHFLLSNPPYVSDAEWEQVAPNVKDHEPHAALRGGVDGLSLIRRLINESRDLMATHGQLVIEIAASQRDAVLELTRTTPGWDRARVINDFEGLPRVLIAEAV